MYGVCGKRADGDYLNCPWNNPAPKADDKAASVIKQLCPSLWAESDGHLCCDGQQAETMQQSLRRAEIFIIGCPACLHNFRNLFCTLFCSPDQATFTNITSVQRAPRNATGGTSRRQVTVEDVAFYLDESYKNSTYDSCKDVIFSIANQRAMTYIGNSAQNAQEFLDFLGTVKDKSPLKQGSPIQLDFPDTADGAPGSIQPWNNEVPSCWNNALKCSCGDCPDAPTCQPPPVPKPDAGAHSCATLGLPNIGLPCQALGAWLAGALVLAVIAWAFATGRLSTPQRQLSETTAEQIDAAEMPLLDAAAPPRRSSEDARLLAAGDLGSTEDLQHMQSFEQDPEQASSELVPKLHLIEARLRVLFRTLGHVVTSAPHTTILICIVVTSILISGLMYLDVETEPLRLWVPPESQAARDKASYDRDFGPFYRIEQLVISKERANSTAERPLIFADADEAMQLVFDVHDIIDAINVTLHKWHDKKEQEDYVVLQDICYKPFGDVCATESVAQYWALDRAKYKARQPSIQYCLSHWSTECRSAFNAPLEPKLVLGGYPTDDSFTGYLEGATALLITIPVDANSPRHAVRAWEAGFIHTIETAIEPLARQRGYRVSYSAESSVQSELSRESFLDIATVAGSYAAMFIYITIAISKPPPSLQEVATPSAKPTRRSMLVYTRVSLALAGVALVFASVCAALGICSLMGLSSTLIVMEVIPFLVLAVGVDNMFIIALQEAAQPAYLPVAVRVTNALELAGPSIAFAATAEVTAFAIAGMTSMPAVRSFARVAAVAVAVDFVLQVTAFVAFLALDCKRTEEGRCDCVPCLRIMPPAASLPTRNFYVGDEDDRDSYEDGENADAASRDNLAGTQRGSSHALQHLLMSSSGGLATPEDSGDEHLIPVDSDEAHYLADEDAAAPWLGHALSSLHARLLAPQLGKLVVLVVFVLACTASVSLLWRVDVGLDQSVALPKDSYLQDYYADVLELARVGPPVMFVVEHLNVGEGSPDIDAVCASAGCDDASMLNRIATAAQRPYESYLASPAASWIDDFFAWTQPELVDCCRQHTGGDRDGFCAAPDVDPCKSHPDQCKDCETCLSSEELTKKGRPDADAIRNLLPGFLDAEPSASCAKGGLGVYSDQIAKGDSRGSILGLEDGWVTSSFRAFSAPLGTQKDFIAALAASRRLVEQAATVLRKAHDGFDGKQPHVFAYSIFHPFFEQYLTIRGDAAFLLGTSALAVIAVVCLFTASLRLALVLALCLLSLLVNMMGVMVLVDIQLNAVSLVNLAMSLGIAVEFFAHIGHQFHLARGGREERLQQALKEKGAAVCSGILLTKLVGVATLALSTTQIFQVYYFRMYLALVVLGSLHAILLLPVLLALIGPNELPLVLQRHSILRPEFQPVTHRSPYIISRSNTPEVRQ